MSNNNMIKIGALWKNQMKNGKEFLSGNFGDGKLLVFQNRQKKHENSPDYIVCIGEREKKEQTQERPAQSVPPTEDQKVPF